MDAGGPFCEVQQQGLGYIRSRHGPLNVSQIQWRLGMSRVGYCWHKNLPIRSPAWRQKDRQKTCESSDNLGSHSIQVVPSSGSTRHLEISLMPPRGPWTSQQFPGLARNVDSLAVKPARRVFFLV